MKINFIPVKITNSNNLNLYKNRVSFGEIDEACGFKHEDFDRFDRTEPDYNCNGDDIFYANEHESKFKNLPKAGIERDRVNAYVNYLSGYEDSEDDDFIERMTY